MKIELLEINEENREECLALKAAPSQAEFIASNEKSLRQAEEAAGVARPYAIYADGEMIGFTMFAFDHEEKPGQKYWLWRFMIDEKFQGKGYGRYALREILKYFREHGADTMTLSTKASNTRALSLYHQFGFWETGEENDGEIVLKLCF